MRTTFAVILAAAVWAGGCAAEEPGTWLAAGSPVHQRQGAFLIAIPNDRVFAVGEAATINNTKAETYSEATNTWTLADAAPSIVSMQTTAVRLADGRVLYAGGNKCDIFDPATDDWQNANDLNQSRSHLASVLLADGNVLVVGGGTDVCELYSPGANNWTLTGSLSQVRDHCRLVRLLDGRVVACSDNGVGTTAEIFNNGVWTNAGMLNVRRFSGTMTMTLLPSGKVLVAGGQRPDQSPGILTDCEVFDPSTLTWTPTIPMSTPRTGHAAIRLASGKVLVMGGLTSDLTSLASCELYDEGTGQWTSAEPMPQGAANGNAVLLSDNKVLYATGTLNGMQPPARYTTNDAPGVAPQASPRSIQPGETSAFTANASDSNGDMFSLLWDFKDGTTSNETNPIHTFAAAGTYDVTLTATDPAGFAGSGSVTVLVVGGRPAARFVTSDIVGFAGQPFTFDASLSTDPQNGIVSYAWTFGDGSPAGAGQVISKIFGAEGAYTVRLDVTDNDGLVGSAQREIVILPADQLGKFNSAIAFKTKFDRNKEDADSLTLDAVVNVGADTLVAGGAAVAFELVGQRFEGTLNAKLQDFSNKNEKWLVKAGTKKQGPGEVVLKLTLKKANLGLGFNQAGVLPKTNSKDPVEVTLPVKLEIAGRIFEIDVDATFKFNKDGKKASGDGEN